MHNGRTIQELIDLVQRIYANTGNRTRPSRNLAAADRNPLDRKDQHISEGPAALRSSQVSAATQPAWLAVFQ